MGRTSLLKSTFGLAAPAPTASRQVGGKTARRLSNLKAFFGSALASMKWFRVGPNSTVVLWRLQASLLHEREHAAGVHRERLLWAEKAFLQIRRRPSPLAREGSPRRTGRSAPAFAKPICYRSPR